MLSFLDAEGSPAQTTRSQHFVCCPSVPFFLHSLTVAVGCGPGAVHAGGQHPALVQDRQARTLPTATTLALPPPTLLNPIKLTALKITRSLFTPFIMAFPCGIRKVSFREF